MYMWHNPSAQSVTANMQARLLGHDFSIRNLHLARLSCSLLYLLKHNSTYPKQMYPKQVKCPKNKDPSQPVLASCKCIFCHLKMVSKSVLALVRHHISPNHDIIPEGMRALHWARLYAHSMKLSTELDRVP